MRVPEWWRWFRAVSRRFEACGPCDVGGAGDVQPTRGRGWPGSLANTEDGDTSDPDINDAVVDGQVEFTVDSITSLRPMRALVMC